MKSVLNWLESSSCRYIRKSVCVCSST